MTGDCFNLIREMKARKPFVPFQIVTTTGDRLVISDRFQFAVVETKLLYVCPASDRFIEIRSNQIARVERVEQKPAA